MVHARNHYTLPLPLDSITDYSKRRRSPYHRGITKHALDFYCAEGTPVYAARGGKVVWVQDHYRTGKLEPQYWYMGNRIVIRHTNGEYSAYEHLKYKGVLVKPGHVVKKGQLIGRAGNTGYTAKAHLHFEVFIEPIPDESEGETVEVEFSEMKKWKKKR